MLVLCLMLILVMEGKGSHANGALDSILSSCSVWCKVVTTLKGGGTIRVKGGCW